MPEVIVPESTNCHTLYALGMGKKLVEYKTEQHS
jgi:hypothetical protein